MMREYKYNETYKKESDKGPNGASLVRNPLCLRHGGSRLERLISNGASKKLYKCPECGFKYKDDSTSLTTGKEWAEKCKAWCKKYKSCNLEIIKHAV